MLMQKRLGWMMIVVLVGAAAGMLALAFAPGAGRLVTAEASQARPDSQAVQSRSASAASLSEGAPSEVSMLVVGTALIGLGAVLRRAA